LASALAGGALGLDADWVRVAVSVAAPGAVAAASAEVRLTRAICDGRLVRQPTIVASTPAAMPELIALIGFTSARLARSGAAARRGLVVAAQQFKC
jgi:hypothetical protein